MKKEVAKSKKIVAALLCSIVIVFTIIVVAAISSPDPKATSNDTPSSSETINSNTSQDQKEKVIYADDNFKITYVDFLDPKSGVTAFNLLLKIENDSDKEVIASLSDGYANDTAVFFGSGMPIKIKPDKNAVGVFILGYANTDITNIDEINTLEFKITLYDENYSEKVLETENIILNLK